MVDHNLKPMTRQQKRALEKKFSKIPKKLFQEISFFADIQNLWVTDYFTGEVYCWLDFAAIPDTDFDGEQPVKLVKQINGEVSFMLLTRYMPCQR